MSDVEIDELSYESINDEYNEKIHAFDCGKDIVNDFLKEDALNLHQIRQVTTHLAFNQNRDLVGYFSLFNESVTVVKSKRNAQDWFDLSGERKSVFPSVRLHYFGVDSKYQCKGLGEQILFYAIEKTKELSNVSGCLFMTLETYPEKYNWYKKRFFTHLSRSDHDSNLTNMCLRISTLFPEASAL